MGNMKEKSLLEVVVELMERKRTVQNIFSLIKEALEIKGLNDEDNKLSAQLYVDITTSSKFVFMGDDLWDLKSRQSLDQFDKDGSSFNSKDEEYYDEDEIDDLDEEDLNDSDDDYDDEDEDEESDDDYDVEFDDEEYDDEESDDDDDDDLDDEPLERYDEEFDEDKYNDYMDDFENMYED